MPNYSHTTKPTPPATAAAEAEPPYLTVGTDVSAKYKGAFCEAKIIQVDKQVKLRVLFQDLGGTHLIDDTEAITNAALQVGAKIEAKHPKKKQPAYVEATVAKVLDHSRYTVVFDDGDQCVLRRNSICLKSGKHFAESDTLDQLPLTNPEHFGNPVKAHIPRRHSQAPRNVQLQTRHRASSPRRGSISKSRPQRTSVTDAPVAERREGPSSPSNSTRSSGRRDTRKRRESTSKYVTEHEDGSTENSKESTDIDQSTCKVDFDLIQVGVKLMVRYGRGRVQNVYEAKVNKIETNSSGRIRYFVHYTGWNSRYDEWVTKNRLVRVVSEKESARDGRSHPTEPMTPESQTTATAAFKADAGGKAKDKEEEEVRTKTENQIPDDLDVPIAAKDEPTPVEGISTNSHTTDQPTTVLLSKSLNRAERIRKKRYIQMEVDSETDRSEQRDESDEKEQPASKRVAPRSFKSMDFCSEITEQDCDKKISILQGRIIELRQFYMFLKSGLADLDRKRKRPRTEMSV